MLALALFWESLSILGEFHINMSLLATCWMLFLEPIPGQLGWLICNELSIPPSGRGLLVPVLDVIEDIYPQPDMKFLVLQNSLTHLSLCIFSCGGFVLSNWKSCEGRCRFHEECLCTRDDQSLSPIWNSAMSSSVLTRAPKMSAAPYRFVKSPINSTTIATSDPRKELNPFA